MRKTNKNKTRIQSDKLTLGKYKQFSPVAVTIIVDVFCSCPIFQRQSLRRIRRQKNKIRLQFTSISPHFVTVLRTRTNPIPSMKKKSDPLSSKCKLILFLGLKERRHRCSPDPMYRSRRVLLFIINNKRSDMMSQ